MSTAYHGTDRRDTDLNVNNDKAEFMRFKQDSVIATLSDEPLKGEDYFTYLSSNISSPESDDNIFIGKV